MKRSQFRTLALTAATLGVLTLPALAQDAAAPSEPSVAPPTGEMKHGGPGAERFKATDTNNDGFLSKDEMRAEQEKRMNDLFQRLDTNNDSKLSPDEMRKGREKLRDKMKGHPGEPVDGGEPKPEPVEQPQ